MKYIYDIILNFNEKYYEFYEWNDSDSVDYIKKIPIFKVSNEVIRDLKVDKIEVDNDFINEIYNKTEIYTNTGISKLEYICLFCSDDTCIAIEFNHKGISIYKSDLVIDEKLDIVNYLLQTKPIKLKYKILNYTKNKYITRKEANMINFIKRELKDIKNNYDKLKYLYYECFNKTIENNSKMIIDLEKYIENNPTKIFNLLIEINNLT